MRTHAADTTSACARANSVNGQREPTILLAFYFVILTIIIISFYFIVLAVNNILSFKFFPIPLPPHHPTKI